MLVGFNGTMYSVEEGSFTPVLILVLAYGVTLDRNVTIDFITDSITAEGMQCLSEYIILILLSITMHFILQLVSISLMAVYKI